MADKVRVRQWRNPTASQLLTDLPSNTPVALENSSELQPQLLKITDGVYVGVDYGFANSVFLEGPEKLIVVDTTEGVINSTKILQDFRKICSKPIAAIVYTDHHADHTQGLHAYVEDPSNPPDIWAHVTQKKELHQVLLTEPRVLRGNVFQFGLALTAEDESGENPRFHKDMIKPVKLLKANKYVTQDLEEVEIAGIKLTFIYQPGEANDELAIWLPDKRVLLVGDNYYPEFPNIYSMRGVAPRSALDWYQSLAKLRQLNAHHFIAVHGRPIEGEAEIREVLTVYMSAIQFVHDQTVRFLNQGLHPDEIASRIKLPSTLSQKPYLTQEYGMLEWSIKGVYNQLVGWFNEDPLQLQPHTPAERSKRMVEMVGKEGLLKNAETALNRDDPQWALELASYVLSADPKSADAKDIRTEALRSLAGKQTNPVARNFYLTEAFNDHNLIDWNQLQENPFLNLDTMEVLDVLKTKLKAELVEGVELKILLHISDTGASYQLQIKYSVLTVDVLNKDEWKENTSDVKIVATEELWKSLLINKSEISKEGLQITGAVEKLKEFLNYFDV